jgi:aryl-alcohol dehydrogenase-like predicted oxidoreductase
MTTSSANDNRPSIYSKFGALPDLVSKLGLGTVKFGRNQKVKNACGDGFPLPSDQMILELLDLAIAHGINLIDTAPAYGSSEERLGQLMGARRERLFLMTKTGERFIDNESHYDFSKEATQASVANSLKTLRTDRLDCVMVHCHRDDVGIINSSDVLETLSDLKKRGDIRSFGVSTMSVEGGLLAIKLCDAVMVPFNVDYTEHLPVIEAAHNSGVAVIVKKGFGSGHLSANGGYHRCLEAILAQPGITSVTVGTNSAQHLLENIEGIKAAIHPV